MCGIVGVVERGGDPARWVEAMLRTMEHRGPDGSGVLDCGGGVVFGHRRLSILDLSAAGAQPMTRAGSGCVLTYNGEIYNYLELRDELKRLGAAFTTGTDSEVLLAAYEHWGRDCLARFNGMFAFAIYDPVRRTIFCARDRYGEKPFLFHVSRERFVFASEYKALLLHPALSLEVDETRLLHAAHNASTGLDADRQTVFSDVLQLLPSEAMEVDVDTLATTTWRYWQVEPESGRVVVDENAVFDEFRELLVSSVRLRMRSDVPVGSCLSGGLDSSAIVCIVRRLLGEDAPYSTFSGHFPGSRADEWCYAQQVVEATGVDSYRTEPTVDRFLEELPRFTWHNELPVGSSSQFAQWCVFELARQHGVTVLLDGQGADETLGGYEQYFAYYVAALRESGDEQRLQAELPLIRERYPLALAQPRHALRDRLPLRVRHWLSNRLGLGTSLLYGVRPGMAASLGRQEALPRITGFGPLSSALIQDTFGRYLTTLLRYGDRNSMAHSREVRLPFCDHRIAEFVFGLPAPLLMGEVQTKRLLRESMRGILPESIRTRWNKQGFRPPQDQWFRSPALIAQVREVFSSADFQASPHWIPAWWRRALDRVEQGELSLGWTLWQPYIIEQWRTHFVAEIRRRRVAAWGHA